MIRLKPGVEEPGLSEHVNDSNASLPISLPYSASPLIHWNVLE